MTSRSKSLNSYLSQKWNNWTKKGQRRTVSHGSESDKMDTEHNLTVAHGKLIKEFQLHSIEHLSKEEFNENFKDVTLLSTSGMQAKVYKVKWKNDNFKKFYVLKQFDIGNHRSRDGRLSLKYALNEFRVIKRLKNVDHLVHMHKAFYTYKKKQNRITVWILMDLYRDFYDYITGPGSNPTTKLVYKWFNQLVNALNELHQNGILHRDIKIDNLLLDKVTEDIYLADFGLLCELKTKEPCYGAGSAEYAAPEIYINDRTTEKSDMCSLGITFWCIWVGMPYYPQEFKKKMESGLEVRNDYIREWNINFSPEYMPRDDPWNLWLMLRRMCDPNPSRRPSTQELKDWIEIKTFPYQKK